MRARHSLPLTFAVLVVPLVASTATAGCSSRVQDCSELGPDWTACDGADAGPIVANVCVLKTQKKAACTTASGQATTSPTSPGVSDAGVKCSAIAPNVCNGRCVDIRSDEQHCGDCNSPCFTGETCVGGECR
ncbi:MAG: hypothetical protein IPF92_11975 [Myxococcales bacterium]|nr:hypothetical protein [Myxococcales bacterium]